MSDISETVSAGQLRVFIERIERVEEEIRSLNADKSDIYKELRGCGFDVKAVRQCVAARKMDSAEREERNAMFDLYWEALTGSSRVHVHEAPGSSSGRTSEFDSENGGSNPSPGTSELTQTQEQPESEPASQSVQSPVSTVVSEYAGTSPDENPAPLSPSPSSAPRMAADDEAAQPQNVVGTYPPSAADSLPGAVKAPEADSLPASGAVLSEDEIPQFLKAETAIDKPDCRKLKDGHCKISFQTSALCSECNDARNKSRASA